MNACSANHGCNGSKLTLVSDQTKLVGDSSVPEMSSATPPAFPAEEKHRNRKDFVGELANKDEELVPPLNRGNRLVHCCLAPPENPPIKQTNTRLYR